MKSPHRVAILVSAPQSLFELACAVEAFGLNRPGLPNPYQLSVCGRMPGTVDTSVGMALTIEHGLEALATADTVVIAGWPELERPPDRALRLSLVDAHARGARLVGLCFGAFLLASTGVLSGRRATTHWREAGRLALHFPDVDVDPKALFVFDGNIATSAGTGAAVDLCLELIRRDFGSAHALQVSRHMVLPPRRDGGQKQYEAPAALAPTTALSRLLEWAIDHLDERITVPDMAAFIAVSPRTLSRRFEDELGVSPGQWLLTQRLDRARVLLESGDQTLEAVARTVGLSSASNLRRRFVAHTSTTPSAYRRTFQTADIDR